MHQLTWPQDILDISICDVERASYILCGMWSVWNARTARLHGKASVKFSQACRWAFDTAADLILSAYATQTSGRMKNQTYWNCPPEGIFKVNVDATFNVDERNGASGVIIRDHNGHAVAASSTWYEFVPDILTAEAYACRDGVRLMKEWNIKQAIMETDCMEFTSLWKMKNQRAGIMPIINQIHELSEGCSYFVICHIKREANVVAHKLARFASRTIPECAWSSQVPDSIRQCIEQDCNGRMI